ncbi:HEAT repeat domain-containing protein [Reichenbachiella sp. 5M10]|uniref:HEAT repeat domain-containing protein n=1 Tax=Reichenbachiella sp. 5M10 TaxID=1889772 RepID=UPI00117ADF1B|nr:HEAT repeat domain-containing protein [Reichenbachiella sp. 5M10]
MLQKGNLHNDSDLSILLLIGVGASFLALLLIQLTSLKHKTLNELKWSNQYLRYQNRFFKLIRNKYYRNLFAYILLSQLVLFTFGAWFLHTLLEHGRLQSSPLLGMGVFILVAAFFTCLAVSQVYSQRVRTYGISKILSLIPWIVVLSTLICIGIGVFYSFAGQDNSSIRYYIVCNIFTIIVLAFILGFQNTSMDAYFSPLDKRQKNSIENIVIGYGLFIAVAITSGVVYLSTTNIQLHQMLPAHGTTPIALGTTIVLCSVAWFIVYKRMHRNYTALLEKNLDRQRNLIKHDQAFTESLSTILSSKVLTSDFPHVITQLKILKIIDPLAYRESLTLLVDHNHEGVQEYVVKEVQNLHLIAALPKLNLVQESRYFPILKTQKLIVRAAKTLSQSKTISNNTKYVTQLTSSKLANERLYGALLSPNISVSKRGKILANLYSDSLPDIIFNAILGAKDLAETETLNQVINRIAQPEHANAVISALATDNNKIVDLLETAFELNRKNEQVQQRILLAYGKIGNEYAVSKLLDYLQYPNHNVVSVALDALSKCGFTVQDSKMSLRVRTEISDVCEATVWNMSALSDAKIHHCSSELIRALEIEIENKYETLFRLLSLLHDPKSVESVKNNINSSNIDESELASQLLDLFINEELKTYLIPILQATTYQEKIHDLRGFFPCQKFNKKELLTNIIFRDYKWINGWTKTRALLDLGVFTDDKTAEILSAQLVNKHPILREAAAYSLFQNHTALFEELKTRYNQNDRFYYVYETLVEIENKNTSSQSAILRKEIAEFLTKVTEFKDLSGVTIANLTKMITVQHLQKGDEISSPSIQSMDYYFVYAGSVNVTSGEHKDVMTVYDMIHPLNIMNNSHALSITPNTSSIVLTISKTAFSEALYMDESIPKSILKNTKYEHIGVTIDPLVFDLS